MNPRDRLLLAHRLRRAPGPRAAEPAFDYLVQGYAGYMAVTGEPDGPPGKCGVSVIDFAGGYAAMVGLMVGLFDAQRTGVGPRRGRLPARHRGQHALLLRGRGRSTATGRAERVADSAHQTLVPAQNFPTRDGWIVIFCNKDKFWRDLVETLGAPELAAIARFRTFADRFAHKDALLPLLQARFATRTTEEWLARLRGRVPCAPVNDVRQALADPQVLARDMIVEVEHPEFGTLQGGAEPRPHRGRDPPSRRARPGSASTPTRSSARSSSYSDGTIAAALRRIGSAGCWRGRGSRRRAERK